MSDASTPERVGGRAGKAGRARRILALVGGPEVAPSVDRLFRPRRFDLHRVPSAAGALLLAGNRRYDLIVIEGPLVGPELYRFLTQIRSFDSLCADTPVVIAAPRRHVATLSEALDHELVTVVAIEDAPRELPNAVSWVLGVATRSARRILVQVRSKIGRGGADQVVQTENISSSGMLLRGLDLPPAGSRVEVSFSLPHEVRPVLGEAEIVRHTDPVREALTGAAVRFLRLEGDGGERLRDFLEGRQPSGVLRQPPDAAAAR